MSTRILAYSASEAGAPLKEFSYEAKPIGDFDIQLDISHCGVCHSDLHLIDNDWHMSTYPLVPGHEIVGTVAEKGPLVSHLQKGDRVGIGWQRSSCGTCKSCVRGDENLCRNQTATCVGNHGGFAKSVVADSRFAFKIPIELDSANAAPLLCGGITVYAPLRVFGIKPHHKVGIIGIGGLGHLGIQFASAFGCEVTAFSSSPDKEKEAKSYGAKHFVSNTKQFESLEGQFDFILSTVNVDMPWSSYVDMLGPDGNLCFVGIPPSSIEISALQLLGGRKRISGSPIGGRHLIQDMLEFAARHKIQAVTEVVPIANVNDALKKIKANKARYRMVLKI